MSYQFIEDLILVLKTLELILKAIVALAALTGL